MKMLFLYLTSFFAQSPCLAAPHLFKFRVQKTDCLRYFILENRAVLLQKYFSFGTFVKFCICSNSRRREKLHTWCNMSNFDSIQLRV